MKVIEPKALHHMNKVIEGKDVIPYTKMYHEVASLYKTPRDDDPIVYEVYSYTQGENKPGNLNWGLTVMKPVYSNGECNMTKGHFHENRDCAEFYFGISGEGLLILMDEEGNTWAEKIYEGSLHHIDGHVAHRICNTGEVDMKVGACWPTFAGHDYATVRDKEFGFRVFKNSGKLEFKKR